MGWGGVAVGRLVGGRGAQVVLFVAGMGNRSGVLCSLCDPVRHHLCPYLRSQPLDSFLAAAGALSY